MADEQTLRTVLDETARRRATLAWRQGWTLGGGVAAGALVALRIAVALLAPSGALLVALVVVALGIAVAAVIVALRGARTASTPTLLARLLEERHGGLDDVVASAVDYAARADHRPEVARRLDLAALRALGDAPVDAVVAPVTLAAAGRRALATAGAVLVALAIAATPLTRALGIAAVSLVPSRLALTVEPGDVRVRAGRPVTIRARVSGTSALVPSLVTGQGADAVPVEMSPTADGGFEVTVPDVTATFGYHVVAGMRHSDTYTVTVVHPARVERIDLDYRYPPALELEPRHEDDGGDIYAPEGTAVSLRVTADRPVGASALLLGNGTRVPLGVDGRVASGALTITADGSYRIAFVDDDGVEMPDDTEYFIRTLLDRPPDVRVLRPAGDKQVSPLEEVAIEARADDDFGVQAFELVLQKPGDAEVVVPLARGPSGLTANGAHTLYLEDLEVAPGDIVSYYVRARDVGRGKPSSESRSDIYFLEVKAFNDEFVAAQSQAMSASGQAQGVQDLAAAQKEIVVATWKLDSRGRRAGGGRSAADITAVAEAQRALEQRAAKEAGSQLQAAGNATSGRRRRGQATLNTVEDDPLGLAIASMRKAIVELDAKRTAAALPHEMQALDHLLRAESDVQRRQVARQQQGGGGNGNRDAPDLSALFDQELRKQQQTNYETPASSETRQDAREDADPLARLRELARRQEALSREQQDLARQQAALDAETVKRRLERLSRDQEALRKQLEDLSRQLPEQRQEQQGEQSPERQTSAGQSEQSRAQNGQGSRGQAGQQSSGNPSGQAGQPGQQAQSAGGSDDRNAVREALDDMRQATSGLREQDAERASQSAGRALERMRRAEESLRGSTDDDLRQRLGDLQLEARQLADGQRRLTDEQGRSEAATGSARARQLAGEQQRLADRTERLRQRMRNLSQQARGGEGRAALDQAGREMESGRAAELMRQAARALERPAEGDPGAAAAPTPQRRPGEAAGAGGETGQSRSAGPDRGATGTATATTRVTPGAASEAARLGADAARALDRVAERLDSRRTPDAAASTRLSDDLSRTRDLRDRLEAVERSLGELRTRESELRDRAAAAGREDEGRDRAGQPGSPRQPGADGRGSANGDREVSRLQRQLAEDMRQARAQVDALGRTSPDMRGPSTPEAWQPSVSAPGTEAFKQDFARWESLKQNLLLALEKVERGLADELRQEETRDRLNAGASDAVPDDYRQMIDRYYRSLATPRRPVR